MICIDQIWKNLQGYFPGFVLSKIFLLTQQNGYASSFAASQVRS